MNVQTASRESRPTGTGTATAPTGATSPPTARPTGTPTEPMPPQTGIPRTHSMKRPSAAARPKAVRPRRPTALPDDAGPPILLSSADRPNPHSRPPVAVPGADQQTRP